MSFPSYPQSRQFQTLSVRVAVIALVVTGLTAKAGGQSIPPVVGADWESYNNGVRGWRYNADEKTLTPQTAPQLVEKWRFPPAGSTAEVGVIHGTPAVVNGYVYFGTGSYPAFYKLKPNGQVAWVFRAGEGAIAELPKGGLNRIDAGVGFLASPLVTDKAVYVGNNAGVFYALDRLTGRELWKVDTRAPGFPNHYAANLFNASAILADGKIIVGGGGYEHSQPVDPNYPCCQGRGFVVAFDPDDGEVVWKYEVGEKPRKYSKPIAIKDVKGTRTYHYGPSTSSVWSTPSYDAATGTIFFGTDVHNSPREPTEDDPRLYTRYSAAVIAVDVKSGDEKWVTQLNKNDVFNHAMAGYDPASGTYKDCSVGDTPKIYSLPAPDGSPATVLGVGCKNGGFYLLYSGDGRILGNTPVYTGKPKYPLDPKRHPRMIALPSTIGGIQTGCATDGKRIFTNGIDWLTSTTITPGWPEAGRVVCLSANLADEHWRHERPRIRVPGYDGGDPIASGIAVNAGGIACFTSTVSERLVVVDAVTGRTAKELYVGTVWSGPSISRGRIYVGTGSILFLKQQLKGSLISYGLPGEDEIDRMGAGTE